MVVLAIALTILWNAIFLIAVVRAFDKSKKLFKQLKKFEAQTKLDLAHCQKVYELHDDRLDEIEDKIEKMPEEISLFILGKKH